MIEKEEDQGNYIFHIVVIIICLIFGNYLYMSKKNLPKITYVDLPKGWKNYGTSSGSGLTYQKARFYKTKDEVVKCEGLIKGDASNKYEVLFTLPEGYRPKGAHQFRTFDCYGDQVFLYVAPNGNVMAKQKRNYPSINLECVSFLAEQ